MATFKEIVDRALEECNYDFSTTTSTPRTRMKRRVNDTYRRILTRPGFMGLLRPSHSVTFASVAAQTTYGLPFSVGRVNAIYEATNDRRLELRTTDWLRLEDPALTSSGTPWIYVPQGWAPVSRQPSTADQIVMKSSSSSDTAVIVRVEYLNAAGARLTAAATLTGTAATTLVASDCLEITALYLSVAAVGTVTVYQTSTAGNLLLTLPAGYLSVKCLLIQLWPTPAAVITYRVDDTRELADLVQDKEEPLLPADFHHILWRGAVADEWSFKDDSRAQEVKQAYEMDLRHLNHWLWNTADYRPQPDESKVRGSRLGGWFPAGT